MPKEAEIPLHYPDITGKEKRAVQQVMEEGPLKGDGPHDDRCSALLESAYDTERAMMTTSCTHALEMAALLLDIEKGDEVIIPSYTFPSTATAFHVHGATPVFVDIDPETLCIDPDAVAEAITENTSAIVPVHYAGLPAAINDIMAVANDYDIPVVEDAAQAVETTYEGKQLGTFGDIGCFSFHATKSFVAGEGGAILLNDERFVERAEIIRQKGTNYTAFRRGEVEEYEWVDVGSSYVPSELQTALAHTQLQRREEIVAERRRIHEAYMDGLRSLEDDVQLPPSPAEADPNHHLFWIRAEGRKTRDALITHLNENGIGAAIHYRPLHTSTMGRKLGYAEGDLPVTEEAAATLIRLPIHTNLSEDDVQRVVDAIHAFYGDAA